MAIGDLGLLLNNKTGSAFTILAKKSPFVCGFRCWFQIRSDGSNMVELAFRFRVEAEQGTGVETVFKDLLDNHFPDVVWSKVGANYGSLLGSIQFEATQYEKDIILASLFNNQGLSLVWDYMMETLRPMEFQFEDEEFIEYLHKEVADALEVVQVKKPSNPSILTFNSPKGFVYIQDGKDITSGLLLAHQQAVKPLNEALTVVPGGGLVEPPNPHITEVPKGTLMDDLKGPKGPVGPSSEGEVGVELNVVEKTLQPLPKPKGKVVFYPKAFSDPVEL